MLDEGAYRNQSELARDEGESTAAVGIALAKPRLIGHPQATTTRTRHADRPR